MEAVAVSGILTTVFAIVLIISPIGIWNRLIKIHRDNNRNAREIVAALDRLTDALDNLVSGEDEA